MMLTAPYEVTAVSPSGESPAVIIRDVAGITPGIYTILELQDMYAAIGLIIGHAEAEEQAAHDDPRGYFS